MTLRTALGLLLAVLVIIDFVVIGAALSTNFLRIETFPASWTLPLSEPFTATHAILLALLFAAHVALALALLKSRPS
jgi:hypothetical protein